MAISATGGERTAEPYANGEDPKEAPPEAESGVPEDSDADPEADMFAVMPDGRFGNRKGDSEDTRGMKRPWTKNVRSE